ncbi:MAG: shikimate dehydrogenase, partial [Blastocatellia bacterium]
DLYTRLTKLPAAVYKIATRADEVCDVLPIFKVLARAKSENRNLIALAMGLPGFMSRVLGPSHGSFLTFGSIDEGTESAPGQITVDELASVFRVRSLTGSTAIAGVLGCPISHSASPAMHNAAFRSLGADAVYLPIEVRDLRAFFSKFVRPETRDLTWNPIGFSVTIPHKREVIELLDEIDETSRAVGAVNTVVIRGGVLSGYNTDVQGAMQPLEKRVSLSDRHCAVVGAGGSARAVTYGLVRQGARVTLFVRDSSKAAALAKDLNVELCSVQELATSNAEIVINCTPVGMRGHSETESPVERNVLRGRLLAYDLVYNPLQTRFLQDADAEGCQTVSGIEMLAAQAVLQFKLWTGLSVPLELMREAALQHLSRH